MIRKILITLCSGLILAGCTDQTTPIMPNASRQTVADQNLIPTRTVGTGSGDLTVDGKAMKLLPGEVIAIAPGRYSSLTFTRAC